ncbi:unnamed protein product, partial [Allacma fusca]
DFGKKCF